MRLKILAGLALGFAAVTFATPAMADRIPDGSYQRSCRNISAEDGLLRARCSDRRGGWEWSSLRYRRCDGDIKNDDGELRCRRGRDDDDDDRRGITLYDGLYFNGASRHFDGAVRDLRSLGFNDRASSFRIDGRGRWEVCQKTDFRDCTVVDGDGRLDFGGFNNDVTSLRPLRR